MMNSIDLANYDGSLRCYVAHSEGGVNGAITLFLKLGRADALYSSCLKLRFRSDQYEMLRRVLATSPEYPGLDLAGGETEGRAWADLQSETEAIDGDRVS